MNLGLIFQKIAGVCKHAAGNSALFVKAHAPEILLGTGIAGAGATVYSACKATVKARDILESRDECIDYATGHDFPEDVKAEKIKDANSIARKAIIKAYIPAATMGAASVACILGGYGMLNGRLVATAAAYKALETGFDRYRGNVRDEFGDDVDWRMLNSIKPEDMEKAQEERDMNRAIEADNKRKALHHKKKHTAYQQIYSQIFDQYSDRWQRKWTPDQVLSYLRGKQREANDMLRIRKHLFVNEVYDLLGLPRTAEGQVTGWILTQNNPDSYVDFGLDAIPEEKLREILSAERNEDVAIRLNFNPDGLIYNMIDRGNARLYDVT